MRGRTVLLAMLTIAVAGCDVGASQEYTSAEGRFRVHFPGKPKLTEQLPIMSPVGPIVEKTASAEEWSGTARLVSYADYPGGLIHLGNRDSLLDVACQGWATEKKLIILSKASISLDGHPGREVHFEAAPGNRIAKISGRARFYMVGARLYQVCMAGPPGKSSHEAIDGFLDSFALLDHGPPATTKVAGRTPPPVVPPPEAPTRAPASPMGFYMIPDPATEPLIAVAAPTVAAADPSSEPATLSGGNTPNRGARIREFQSITVETGRLTRSGEAGLPDEARHQSFRLSLDLPANAIIEAIVVTGSGSHRWVTRPSDREGPIAIFQNGRPLARTYVAQVGVFSGPQDFDLSIDTGAGDEPGTSFEVHVDLSVAARRIALKSQCRRPR